MLLRGEVISFFDIAKIITEATQKQLKNSYDAKEGKYASWRLSCIPEQESKRCLYKVFL